MTKGRKLSLPRRHELAEAAFSLIAQGESYRATAQKLGISVGLCHNLVREYGRAYYQATQTDRQQNVARAVEFYQLVKLRCLEEGDYRDAIRAQENIDRIQGNCEAVELLRAKEQPKDVTPHELLAKLEELNGSGETV